MKIKTLNWMDAGPMISYVDGHVDIDDFKAAIKADKNVMEYVATAIENELIENFDDLEIGHRSLGKMAPKWDGDIALHLDEDGNNFVELWLKDSEGGEPITAIDWLDFFV